MEPGGIFTTKQQMLDALFNGEFYVNVHSADNPGGEIYAHLSFDAFAEPPIQEELTVAGVDYDIVRFLNQATFGATPRDYEQLRNLIDQDGTNRMQVYELWEDSDSLAAHFEHPYYEQMASLLRGVGFVSSTNQAYLIERGEPVYTEDGSKKTAFFQS